MADALRDDNRVVTLIGIDAGGNVQRAKVDGVTGRLYVAVGASASPAAQDVPVAKRDGNRVPSAMAVESDGTTPQGLLADSGGNLYVSTS